jgi:general secretion pathway protein H
MREARSRRHSGGFSLFEIVVVLAIVTLLISVAAPLLRRSAPGHELRLKAQEIAALMRHGRTLAIRDNREVGITIDLEKRHVELEGVTRPVILPETAGLTILTARGQVVADNASIVFTPQGGSSGGSIALSDGKTAITIAISWLTGDVKTSVEGVK